MLREPRPNTQLPEFFRQLLQGVPLLDGQLVDVSASATASAQAVRHGLGRVYRGAFPVLCDANVVLRALSPVGQDEPEIYLYFQLSAATAAQLRLWVF
jgi:hypothetical protein